MITITNKNIFYSDFSVRNLSSLDNCEIVYIEDIINYLSDNVELGESVTFKRLFEIVSYNVSKFNDIFYSVLGGYTLEPFLQEIENNPTEKFESDYLEIYWHSEKYEDELNISPSLHGVSYNKLEKYAIDFASLNNLKNYNVKLNEKVELFKYDMQNFSDDTLDLGNKSFTLFELFSAIFYEISFFGGPQDKKEKFEEIGESIIEVEKIFKEKKEEEKLYSIDEIIKEFDSKDKYLVKYENLKGWIEKDRIKNKKNIKKLKNCLLEKLKIYYTIKNTDEKLQQYYKQLTDIEYNMQLLYDENEDIFCHKFWETPKCTCPKIDNIENFPSEKPIFDKNCKIHKK